MHWSAREGNENLCRLLLEHNADANIQGYDGCTPLHLSARGNNDCSKIIDLLLKYGVQNINIHDAEGLSPLQLAVRHGNSQAVKKLVDLGADISVVAADKKDARRLELLKNKAERKKQHLFYYHFILTTFSHTRPLLFYPLILSVEGSSCIPKTWKATKIHIMARRLFQN